MGASIFLSTRFRKYDWNMFRALARIYSPSRIAVMAQSAFFAAAIDCQVSETLLMEIPMKQLSKIVVALSIALGSQLSGAASPEAQSYGELVTASPADRSVSITDATPFVNVTGGESVKFVAGDKTFTWRFDGKAGAVKLSEIAPNGFGGKDVTIYVAPNPMYSG